METKKIDSNFEIEIAIEKISDFVESLKNIYIFGYINIKWLTPLDISIEYLLRNKNETDSLNKNETDSVNIWILEKENKRVILIQGEKKFTVEYFLMELQKIL